MNLTLAKVVQTCTACPSQWDAWTTDGQYLYLRYRWGTGTVDAYDDPDPQTWTTPPDGNIAIFGEHNLDGSITLEEFCQQAGLTLAPDAEVSQVTGPLYILTTDATSQAAR